MANLELVALVEGTPQVVAPTASDVGTIAGDLNVAGKIDVVSEIKVSQVSGNATLEAERTGSGTSIARMVAQSNEVRIGSFDAGTAVRFVRNGNNVFELSGAASALNLALDGSAGSIRATFTGFLLKSATDSITAGTTQTQAGATALTTDINRITVCATVGDVVGLPPARVGGLCMIIHDGVENAGVFPKTSGNNIDGAAADAVDPNALVAGTTRVYACVTGDTWETAS